MIITVKSTQEDNSDANDFVNFFPDGLILKPNCEIGLLNITYNIQEGYAVEAGVNNHLTISFPPYNVPQNVNIPTGSYTISELTTEIETQLRATLALMDNLTQKLIPSSTLLCTSDPKKGTFTISSVWNPDSLDSQVSTIVGTDPTGVITGDLVGGESDGYYRKTSTTNSHASNFVTTGNWEAYAFGKVNSSATPEYFHICEMVVNESESHTILGLTTDKVQDASFASFGIETMPNGKFHIFEIISGVRTQIQPPANQRSYSSGDKFEIHMPVQPEKGPYVSPLYYHTPLGGTAALIILTSALSRGAVDPNADFFGIVSIKQPAVLGALDSETNAMADTGLLTTLGSNITNGGTGYIDGEKIIVSGGGIGSTEASFYCIAAGGVITGILGNWYDHGTSYSATEVLTLTGSISKSSDARITVASVDDAVGGNFGTLYAQNDVLTDPVTGMVITVTAKDAAGAITEFDVTTPPNPALTLGQQVTFPNPHTGGSPAILDFRALEDNYPTISGLKFTGLALSPTFHPLITQITQELGGSTLGPIIGIPNTTSNNNATLSVTGISTTPNNRTANNLLVHVDNFPIRSRHYLGEGRCVMALPFGDNSHPTGLFQDRSYNLTYHSLHNKDIVNHNEMRIRITDADGNKLLGIHHPVVLNFDLRPKII